MQEAGRALCDEEDLVRRVNLALTIARRTIEHLGESGYRDGNPDDSFGPDKPLAETAMLLYVVASARGKFPIRDLCLQLVPLARSARTALAISLHPTICFQLGMPHLLLSRLDFPDARFDRLLALSAGSLAHRGREVLPHRLLETLWLRSLWSNAFLGEELDLAASKSVLGFPLDLLWGSREDAYALTHTFMYFTNFGYQPRALPRPGPALFQELEGLLARSLLIEDFDLVAEILMAWPLTARAWSPAAAFGLRVLAELEDRVGFLPSGNGIPERFSRLEGGDRTKYALAASYHTAYVMGMLCALALRRGVGPPAEVADSGASIHRVEVLLGMMPTTVDSPWRRTFGRLGAVEEIALVPFLLDLALLANVRSNDMRSSARLLEFALAHGLADAPVCAQTAELLERLAACAAPGSAGR